MRGRAGDLGKNFMDMVYYQQLAHTPFQSVRRKSSVTMAFRWSIPFSTQVKYRHVGNSLHGEFPVDVCTLPLFWRRVFSRAQRHTRFNCRNENLLIQAHLCPDSRFSFSK